MKKIVLHIAEASGGVERYLKTLLTKIKKYEDIQHILVCSTSYDRKKFEGLVNTLVVIEEMHNSISFVHDSRAILAVRRVIKKYNPDIIYCHSSKAGAIGRIANIGIKKKIIYNAHGWSFNIKNLSKKKSFFYVLVEKVLALFCDRIVCISDYERQSAIEHGICKSNKLEVINSGINYNELENIQPLSRSSLRIPEDAFIVGTIGRLTPQKAPDVFIKMASLLKSKINSSFFLIVGDDISDGSVRQETESLIKKAGLEGSFFITGWVDNPLDYASLFDVAVLLSRWEGFGLVLPEYMYMKKPIVATNADAIPYVLGNAGFLVDIDDYKKAAEYIISIYENDSIVKKLVDNGQERVKLFNSQRTADEHNLLFRELFSN